MMKYIKESTNSEKEDKKILMDLINGLFKKRKLKVEIIEKNMNIALNVTVGYYASFDDIINVLDAFRSVEGGMSGYNSEVELWEGTFTLYLNKDKKNTNGYHPDIRVF